MQDPPGARPPKSARGILSGLRSSSSVADTLDLRKTVGRIIREYFFAMTWPFLLLSRSFAPAARAPGGERVWRKTHVLSRVRSRCQVLPVDVIG